MSKRTVSTAPFEWQRDANDLLGANLVGNVCGKKTRKQAYCWSREPGTNDAQHGPLMHVCMLCEKLVADGDEGREAATDAARILVMHLNRIGIPVRLAHDMPETDGLSASMASQMLHRATSDTIQAGVDNKPPAVVTALSELVVMRALEFAGRYANEYRDGSKSVRFYVPLPPGPTSERAEQVLKDRTGVLRACFKAIWRRIWGE